MLHNFAVTFGKNCRGQIVTEAKQWAEELKAPFVPRPDSLALSEMLAQNKVEALLIATTTGPHIFTAQGTFFFHLGMGRLRWKKLFVTAGKNSSGDIASQAQENDYFPVATGLKAGDRYLDCTLGLAGDAVIASHLVGARGKVMGLEASPLLYFVVSKGLKTYDAGIKELNTDLRRIETCQTEAGEFLKKQAADSYDVVYFDPMFRFPVKKSTAMSVLRPLAWEQPLAVETVQEALRIAPKVVIKERRENILRELGCTEFVGGRYSKFKFGICHR